MLIAQNIPRVRGDAFDHISALTAINFDGKILWQSAAPTCATRCSRTTRRSRFTTSTPTASRKSCWFRTSVEDPRRPTGKVLKRKDATRPSANRDHPYDLMSGDSLPFLNLSGGPTRKEIIIKNRYDSFWVYNNKLQLLWKGQGQTGHYPYPFDSDGDGREEIYIGYAKWSPDGKPVWSQDTKLKDHADGVHGQSDGRPKAKPRAYSSGSDEGFIVIS